MWVRRRRWKSACSLLTLCRSEAEAYLHTSYAVSLLQFPPSTRRLTAYGMQAWHGEGEGRISFCHPAANLSSLHHSLLSFLSKSLDTPAKVPRSSLPSSLPPCSLHHLVRASATLLVISFVCAPVVLAHATLRMLRVSFNHSSDPANEQLGSVRLRGLPQTRHR